MRGRTLAALVLVTAATWQCGGEGFRHGGGPLDSGGSGGNGGSGKGGMAGSGGRSSPPGGSEQEGGAGQGGDTTTSAGVGGQGGESGVTETAGAGGALAEDTPVHGKVVHASGRPLVGWRVTIAGIEVTTDNQGEFTFPDVDETYDLLVTGKNNHKRLYQGLTTREPVAVMSVTEGDPGWVYKSVSVSGTVQISLPYRRVELWVDGAWHWTSSLLEEGNQSGPVDFGPFDASWNYADDPVSLKVVAVSFDSGLWRMGSTELSVAAGNQYIGLELMQPSVVPFRPVTVTVEPLGGTSFTSVEFCISESCFLSPSLSEGLPQAMALNPRVRATGGHADGTSRTTRRIAETENEATLELTAPPAALTPLDGAAGVDPSLPYTWEPYASGIHLLKVFVGSYLVEVYTSGTSFTLGSIEGLAYGSGVHTWQVIGVGPATSVDDVVTGEPLLASKNVEYWAESTPRTFTP